MIKSALRTLLLLFLVLPLAGCSMPGDEGARKGVQLYSEGKYDEAVKELKTALDAGVQSHQEADIWTILGNCHDELEQYDDAVAAHKKALEIGPESATIWTNLGATYRHMDNYEEAEKAYQKAMELDPNYPEAHASLGALYIFQDKPEEAVTTLEKAVELDGTIPVSHANLSFAYAHVGRFEDADKSLKKATELGYRNTESLQSQIDALKAEAGR